MASNYLTKSQKKEIALKLVNDKYQEKIKEKIKYLGEVLYQKIQLKVPKDILMVFKGYEDTHKRLFNTISYYSLCSNTIKRISGKEFKVDGKNITMYVNIPFKEIPFTWEEISEIFNKSDTVSGVITISSEIFTLMAEKDTLKHEIECALLSKNYTLETLRKEFPEAYAVCIGFNNCVINSSAEIDEIRNKLK